MVCDGYHEGGIYKLNIAPCVSYIASELLIDLWHQRFRHLNQDSLVKNTSLVEGLPSLQKGNDHAESYRRMKGFIGGW